MSKETCNLCGQDLPEQALPLTDWMMLGNGFFLSKRSLNNLKGVHVDLQNIVKRAIVITEIDFVVIEGVRDYRRQQTLFSAGASGTLNSRHLTGHAVDVAALLHGKASWDWPLYTKIAKAFKQAAEELQLEIEWGGDWTRLRDGPHFQLPWSHKD